MHWRLVDFVYLRSNRRSLLCVAVWILIYRIDFTVFAWFLFVYMLFLWEDHSGKNPSGIIVVSSLVIVMCVILQCGLKTIIKYIQTKNQSIKLFLWFHNYNHIQYVFFLFYFLPPVNVAHWAFNSCWTCKYFHCIQQGMSMNASIRAGTECEI